LLVGTKLGTATPVSKGDKIGGKHLNGKAARQSPPTLHLQTQR